MTSAEVLVNGIANGSPETTTTTTTSNRPLCMPGERQRTYIAQLAMCLQACLEQLDITTKTHPTLLTGLENMACLIHESMSVSSRNYHSVQHVFDVVEKLEQEDPIAIIAALFHDCVYYHVDGGLSELQFDKLRGAVLDRQQEQQPEQQPEQQQDQPQVVVVTSSTEPQNQQRQPHSANGCRSGCGGVHSPWYEAHNTTPCQQDKLLCLVEKVFGYKAGEEVTHQNGLNEFLSAVICVRELEPFVPPRILAQIACCIEATIPFRDVVVVVDDDDKESRKTCMDRLYDNLSNANEYFELGLSNDEIIKSVQRAALLANADVANFGTTDVVWFLDNTWSLLPESNEGLRRKYLYTVEQFQFAIFKMYGFFNFLPAHSIFPYYQGVPTSETIAERMTNAQRNLEVGRKYLSAKLLSLSVLAAFAELTGGDAPIALFMGDLPSRHNNKNNNNCALGQPIGEEEKMQKNGITSVCNNLANVGGSHPYPDGNYDDDDDDDNNNNDMNEHKQKPTIDDDAYEVLSKGRRLETFFDVKQSPMAAYLYRMLGDEELMAVLQTVKVYPMTTDTALALLRRLPRVAVTEVANHMATRRDQICETMNSL